LALADRARLFQIRIGIAKSQKTFRLAANKSKIAADAKPSTHSA
jgi:hypothetical protein